MASSKFARILFSVSFLVLIIAYCLSNLFAVYVMQKVDTFSKNSTMLHVSIDADDKVSHDTAPPNSQQLKNHIMGSYCYFIEPFAEECKNKISNINHEEAFIIAKTPIIGFGNVFHFCTATYLFMVITCMIIVDVGFSFYFNVFFKFRITLLFLLFLACVKSCGQWDREQMLVDKIYKDTITTAKHKIHDRCDHIAYASMLMDTLSPPLPQNVQDRIYQCVEAIYANHDTKSLSMCSAYQCKMEGEEENGSHDILSVQQNLNDQFLIGDNNQCFEFILAYKRLLTEPYIRNFENYVADNNNNNRNKKRTLPHNLMHLAIGRENVDELTNLAMNSRQFVRGVAEDTELMPKVNGIRYFIHDHSASSYEIAVELIVYMVVGLFDCMLELVRPGATPKETNLAYQLIFHHLASIAFSICLFKEMFHHYFAFFIGPFEISSLFLGIRSILTDLNRDNGSYSISDTLKQSVNLLVLCTFGYYRIYMGTKLLVHEIVPDFGYLLNTIPGQTLLQQEGKTFEFFLGVQFATFILLFALQYLWFFSMLKIVYLKIKGFYSTTANYKLLTTTTREAQ